MLRPLSAADAGRYHRVVQANRAHLTQFGNYEEEVAGTEQDFAEGFATPGHRYGIWRGGELIGRIDLVAVDPPRYGFGFWLAAHATGCGYATAAGAALLAHARDELGASDVYAGVTHGNDRSVAVLRRLGFQPIVDFDDYTRFHRPLAGV
ncbi:GNAT family N-acetyltransferase [Luedemannella flava]